MERPNADVETRGQAVSGNRPRLQFLGQGDARAVGERCARGRRAGQLRTIKNRQQRQISATTRQIEKRHRQDERIFAGRKLHWSTEEALVLAHIARRGMCESHLSWTPHRASGNAASAHPRRKQQFGRLAGCRHAAGQAMRQDGPITRRLESDLRGLVDQTLIATDTLERGAKRRARDHRIEVDVERAELGLFRNVQTEIVVARCPYTVGQEADARAHRHGRVGLEQHGITMPCVWRNGGGS